jgi:hypothetical protein
MKYAELMTVGKIAVIFKFLYERDDINDFIVKNVNRIRRIVENS